jgi:phosphomannomutase
VDENGEFVPGDFMTALLAEATLDRHPGATILYDLRASRAVPDTIERCGGRAVRSRVGHAFIKVRMREEQARFAGEVSGHYYFQDFYSVDTGIVPALVLLELVSRKGGSLAELIRPFREKYHISGEINTPVRDVALKLQELKDRFGAGADVSHLDGVSIDFPDWHFNVRPSNTEPLLRLNLEAYTDDDMVRRRDEVLAVINA